MNDASSPEKARLLNEIKTYDYSIIHKIVQFNLKLLDYTFEFNGSKVY